MPTYTYECPSCHRRSERTVIYEDRDLRFLCPKCRSIRPLCRVPSLPAPAQFKGPGFHCNDYPRSSQ